jgi:hypothetical protein
MLAIGAGAFDLRQIRHALAQQNLSGFHLCAAELHIAFDMVKEPSQDRAALYFCSDVILMALAYWSSAWHQTIEFL